jgi:hypothetical protein
MKQVIVFPFFGEKYLNQFKVCAKTIPSDWNVVVITDQNYLEDRFTVLRVDTPVSAYDCMTFRKRIPEFVNIDDFDRVWHCDPDVLFTGDLLEKYSNPPWDKYIIVSEEPMTRIDCPEMGMAFNADELEFMVLNHYPAINGGLIGVPKSLIEFWRMYDYHIDHFHSGHPNVMSCDQQVLNLLYHVEFPYLPQLTFALTDLEDVGFPTRGTHGQMMNHYIGANLPDKDKIMEADLNF